MEKNLEEQIQKLISLGDNWDSEGAVAIKKETADKAIKYIQIVKKKILELSGLELKENPRISPGPDESIDLEWRTADYHILINIPPGSELPDYSAKIKNKEFSGTF